MKKKFDIFLIQTIYWIFGILFFLILILVLCLGERTEYTYKAVFALPNFVYLFMGMLVWCTIRVMEGVFVKKMHAKIFYEKGIFFATAAFAVMLVYLVYNYYFLTGWDSGLLVSAADEIAAGGSFAADSYESGYFSMYPNNLFLVFLFSVIIRIAGRAGILGVQCVLLAFTGYLLFRIVYQVYKSYKAAWNAWLLFVMTLGVCPWVSIPYSDSIGVFFPVFVLYLYVQAEKQKKAMKWFWFGAAAFAGYKIKPQLFIIFLAVLIIKGIQFLQLAVDKKSIDWKGRGKVAAATLGGMFAALIAIQTAVASLPIAIDKKQEFEPAHFVMMGLNSETNGAFFYDDVIYTSEQTSEERTDANLEVIQARLKEYGVSGLAEHLVKKTLNNYADGTWSWGGEGEFFLEYLEDKNHLLSPFLKSLYYCSGERYQYYSGYAQMMWLLLLFGCVLTFVFRKERESEEQIEVIVLLSLVGLTLFQLLFESRARYLYCYVPFYIFLAVLGLERMIRFGAEKNEVIKKIFGYHNH